MFRCRTARILEAKIGIDDLKSLESDPAALENLQILAPVINPAWGTYQLNSYLQSWVGNNINRKGDYQEIGTQKIYKNDKVIQLQIYYENPIHQKKNILSPMAR